MTMMVNPRLCGGTFFTLLLEDRKQRTGVRKRFAGISDGMSDPDILIALIEVLYPDYDEPMLSMRETFDSNVSKYKACKNFGGTYMPFTDKAKVKAMRQYVKEEYQGALNAMCGVSQRFLDIQTKAKKDERLIKALVDLISQDDSIDEMQEFFVLENGGTLTKSRIRTQQKICFEPFLLGIWFFAALREEGNRIGEDTYDAWCPAAGGAPRVYSARLGEELDHNIKLSYAIPKDVNKQTSDDNEENDEDTITECEEEDGKHENDAASSPFEASRVIEQQIINQNPTFFNFNISGNNHQFFQNAETVNIYNVEKKDG